MSTTPGLDGAHPAWVPTLFGLSQLTEVLSSASREPSPEGRVPLACLPTGHGGILGAQMLGQMVILAESRLCEMQVRTAAMRFIRRSNWETQLEARAEMHSGGRRFASATVSFLQQDVVVARGDVLLAASPQREVPTPGARSGGFEESGWRSTPHAARALWPWEVREGDGCGPVTEVWSRVPTAPDNLRLSRAILAFATEPLTIPLAIDRVGSRATGGHIPQAVVSHSISFVRDLDVSSWHRHRACLLAAVQGHLTGAGEVFDDYGRLAATTETIAIIG